MELRIAAWQPILAPVPLDHLHDAYVWAMQNRNNQFPLSALEIVDAWKHLVQRAETEGSSNLRDDRLLTENAAGACARCYKRKDPATGRIIECLEIDPASGDLMGPCDHQPLSADERAQAKKFRDDFLTNMRAEARRVAQARRIADDEKAKEIEAAKPQGHALKCSGCQRSTDTLLGWLVGETCGALLKVESETCPKCQTQTAVQSKGEMVCRECFHSYDLVTCKGRMELS